jgi:hypothetical protein
MCKESLINSNNVHLGPRTGLPDTILKGDQQRIIIAKLESNWPSSLRGKKLKFHPPFLFLATVAMLVECLDCRTQFWKGVIKGLSKVYFQLAQQFQRWRFFKFPSPCSVKKGSCEVLPSLGVCRPSVVRR